MHDERIHLKDDQAQLQRNIAKFQKDSQISEHNKALILRYLRDSMLGKTVWRGAKKKIGPARQTAFLNHLKLLAIHIGKDLEQCTQDDMERFIEALETDTIRSQKWGLRSKRKGFDSRPYAPGYKADIKGNIRRFYKWLWGKCRTYPELVDWIDTSFTPREIPALTPAEIERLLDRARTSVQKALVQTLFDGGFRLGELLNVRLCHVHLRVFDPADASKRCFFIRIPFSKTLPRTVALPMQASTKSLLLWLEDHPSNVRVEADGSLSAQDDRMQLFPMTGNAVRLVLYRLGKYISKRVYPHLLRHSSATYWANKLPYFKFCKRFGWTMTSDMPQRYIDRAGVDEEEVANIYYEDERSRLLRQNQILAAHLTHDGPAEGAPSVGLQSRPSPPTVFSDARVMRGRRFSMRQGVPP